MREGYASRTAEQNALFRALESFRPESERTCDDPLARHFLTWPFTLVARLAAIPGLARSMCSFIDRRWPGVRSSVVARTRLIDDAMAAALDNGVEQVVILGAGFDSRAYRMARLAAIDVFEIDHPDTRPSAFVGTKNLFASLEKAGERLTFGMEPRDVPQYLAERGLVLEHDIGAAEYRERYFGAKAQRMRGHEFYRVALARVDRRSLDFAGASVSRGSSAPRP